MYTYKTNKLPKNTVEITLNLPVATITKEKEAAFIRLQAELTVEGFRKGKAPRAIAEKNLDNEAVYQEMMKVILPTIYEEIVKKEKLLPIVNPKIDLIKAKEKEDWEIKITLCEKPTIDLGKYKEAIKEVKAKAKKDDIWVPGKESTKAPTDKENSSKLINEILGAVLKEAKVEVSDMIVEEELNHRLARMVDDIQKIGMTVDAYLKSKNLTMDILKAQYKKEIEDTYRIEFILGEIADKEGIKVEKSDLDKLFTNIKDEKEKKMAEANSYYYASVLRKQKTLDFLTSL
jgi:FKBP-type peptidyl-prolyl cis-trans isomerase (trigger factor)